MKYKIGNKVFIREDLEIDKSYDSYSYRISSLHQEQDIRGQWVTLTGWRTENESYKCDVYSGITDSMINHEKTKIGNETSTNQQYEVY